MLLGDCTHGQLFFSVIDAFINALPPSPRDEPFQPRFEDRATMGLRNEIGLMRTAIQTSSMIFTKRGVTIDSVDDSYGKGSEALEDILNVLDRLVDDQILQDSEMHDSNFPKLQALRAHLQHYDPMISTPVPDEVLQWIKYPAKGAKAVKYREIRQAVELFNQNIEAISKSNINQVESTQTYEMDTLDDEKGAQVGLAQAERLSDFTKTLVQLFDNLPSSCKVPHSAHTLLSGFEQGKVEMLISICDETMQPNSKWHSVQWSSLNLAKPLAACENSLDSICTELKKWRKKKKPLQIQLQPGGRWDVDPESFHQPRIHAPVPEKTLEQLLCLKGDGETSRKGCCNLTVKDKIHLALNVARSLLYLLGSPLLQTPWKSHSILID
ncbi:hypothetical protein K445DRAFT_24122 [Daldinia sp. EC12]|nr:hypothetical protein K445DRAFT_24122 [Daldinia sp. EC12]